MREMKDSRVEWIGQIPAHWNLVRLKSLIVTRDGGAWGEEAAGRDGDMICLRIADFDYQRYCFKSHGELTVRHFKPDVIERLRLMPGDILVEKSGGGEKTPVGRAVLFDKDYSALYSNFMDRLRCKDGINPQWLLYNWATLYANNYTRPYIKQTTGIQNLDISGLLSSQFIALPSENEQEKVLSVVLNESKKVDALIANVQAQIEKLKDYKQSVITEVVTKGLDPAVPMKDSGIEWIGKIAETHTIFRLKYLLDSPMQYGANESGDKFVEDSVRYIRITDITADGKLKNDENNQYLPLDAADGYILKDKDVFVCAKRRDCRQEFPVPRRLWHKCLCGISHQG